MTKSIRINGIFTGSVEARWPGRPPSAIGKTPVTGAVEVGHLGLVGDAQADRSVHGGPGKAVHLYPADHYAAWTEEFGPNPAFAPGGFGENISTTGWDEADVCIGDLLSMGGARVRVSQGRQPCWKLSAKADEETLAYRVRKTCRTGWYFAVEAPGQVAVGDQLTLLERRHPEWTVQKVAQTLFNPRAPATDVAALASLASLDVSWRDVFAERHAQQETH